MAGLKARWNETGAPDYANSCVVSMQIGIQAHPHFRDWLTPPFCWYAHFDPAPASRQSRIADLGPKRFLPSQCCIPKNEN